MVTKYDAKYSHKVIMVFDDEKAKDLVLKRLDRMDDFEGFRKYFEFK